MTSSGKSIIVGSCLKLRVLRKGWIVELLFKGMKKKWIEQNGIIWNTRTGNIYKVLNHIGDNIHVGSTCSSLSKRMHDHERKSHAGKHTRLYNHMERLGTQQFYIGLIENYSCSCKDELRAKEGEWIREVGTLNQRIVGRGNEEWYIDNKDTVLAK